MVTSIANLSFRRLFKTQVLLGLLAAEQPRAT